MSVSRIKMSNEKSYSSNQMCTVTTINNPELSPEVYGIIPKTKTMYLLNTRSQT